MGMLDRILEDRRVTEEEGDLLASYATDLGLLREQVLEANVRYLRDLVNVALSDGVFSELETTDLQTVRRLLGISEKHFGRICATLANNFRSERISTKLEQVLSPLTGKTVCFTGEMRGTINGQLIDRALAQQIAEQNGMIVAKNVTKKLDFLVVADPDSMSTKARKARQYGIRIVAEPVFWRTLGVATE
jgi:DNA polymerase-3 subunit epsilon